MILIKNFNLKLLNNTFYPQIFINYFKIKTYNLYFV